MNFLAIFLSDPNWHIYMEEFVYIYYKVILALPKLAFSGNGELYTFLPLVREWRNVKLQGRIQDEMEKTTHKPS